MSSLIQEVSTRSLIARNSRALASVSIRPRRHLIKHLRKLRNLISSHVRLRRSENL